MLSSIISKFDFLLNRGNDLTEFFWPILYWTKEQVLNHHQIPLWNNLHLAGTPLASDPQSPIFYPINILALFMSIDIFFIFSFLMHIVIGGIGMYICSSKGFGLSKKSSLILALLWTFTPKLFAYLEAGHVGLIYSLAWLPFIVLFTIKKRPTVLALFLALLYFSHLPTFLIIFSTCIFFFIIKRSFKAVIITIALTFALTLVSLLPQISWQDQSTRYQLLEDRDVYPKWSSKFEVARALIIPSMDTEKVIALGIIPTALAVFGFLKLKKKDKIIYASGIAFILLLVLNNASPLYSLLLKIDFYVLLRVSTRFWTVLMLIMLFLIGKAINKNNLLSFMAILGILESATWGIRILQKPASYNPNLASVEVYEFLKNDPELFRVYCTTRCLSQKNAAIYGIELLDGYSTVQQKNFNQHAWVLTGTYWNYYTLSIPPIGTYLYEKAQPNAKALGEYNVKYVVSPYDLVDENFSMLEKIGNMIVYQNNLSVARNYQIYSPNFIRLHTSFDENLTSITIPEVYSPGWIAYLNGNEEVPVLETPNALRSVSIKPDTKYIDLIYQPWKSLKIFY